VAKELIFIDDIRLLQRNLKVVHRIAIKGVKLISLSDITFEWLKEEGIDSTSFHEYEYKGMHDRVMSTAQGFGMGWYKHTTAKGDFTIYNGISTGLLIERSMIYYFMDLLKTASIIKAIIEKEKPDTIYLFTGINEGMSPCVDTATIERIVRLLAQESTIESIEPKDRAKRDGSFLLSPKEITRELFSYINSFLNFIMAAIKGKPKKKIVFYEGFNHIKDLLNKIGSSKGDFDLIHLQRRFSPKIFPDIIKAQTRVEDLQRYRRYRARKKDFSVDIEQIRENLKGYFNFSGVDLLPIAWERIRYILEDYIPNIVVDDILSVENYLRQERPDIVVVENDSAYFERLVTAVSRKKGIRTVVIQHGMTIGGRGGLRDDLPSFDFYPLIADKFLAYGEYTKEWLKAKGADPDSIVVTGASRYDCYYKKGFGEDLNSLKNQVARGKEKLALFILSELASRQYIPTFHHNLFHVKQQVREIAKIAESMQDCFFIIRPHSKDRLVIDLISKETDKFPNSNLIVDRSMDLKALLEITDACIGAHSSALVEAMICGVPVITISHPDTEVDIASFNEYGLSIHANSFDDVRSILEKLLDKRKGLRVEVKEKIKHNISSINYNDDGNATNRIADYITNSL